MKRFNVIVYYDHYELHWQLSNGEFSSLSHVSPTFRARCLPLIGIFVFTQVGKLRSTDSLHPHASGARASLLPALCEPLYPQPVHLPLRWVSHEFYPYSRKTDGLYARLRYCEVVGYFRHPEAGDVSYVPDKEYFQADKGCGAPRSVGGE